MRKNPIMISKIHVRQDIGGPLPRLLFSVFHKARSWLSSSLLISEMNFATFPDAMPCSSSACAPPPTSSSCARRPLA